ncbi:MAG: hypothetical protein RB296_02090 [Acidobacteriota bacterium]|jgi:hypothetical protein|nr:hypothetical protein [Acidobacteriota bacterium]
MNSSTSSSKITGTIAVLLTFLAAFFLFDRGGHYLITRLESAFYGEQDFKARFAEYVAEKEFNTLILGTSRTYEAIHPIYFRTLLNENAYKEAQFGKNPKYNYYFYKFFKAHAGVPDFVIYGIDYFIFNSHSNKRWLARLGKLHESFAWFPAISLLLKNKRKVEEFIEAVIQDLNKRLSPGNQHEIKDFIELQKYAGSLHKPGVVITERTRHYWKQNYPRFPGKEGEYLRLLLSELDRDGVTTFLVLIPNHLGTYRTNFNRSAMLRDLRHLQKGLRNVHILMLDTPEVFPLENEKYFINGGWGRTNCHMSRSGAKKFNRILIKTLRPFYNQRNRASSPEEHTGDRNQP